MCQDGLKLAVESLLPIEFETPGGQKVKITIDDAKFSKPSVPLEVVGVRSQRVLPTECRQRAATYKGDFIVRMTVVYNERVTTIDKAVGKLPIMVRVSTIS